MAFSICNCSQWLGMFTHNHARSLNKNLDKLFEIIDILANGGTLDAKYRDHDLTGNYKGTRECHIEPDWLLIYEICGGKSNGYLGKNV